MERIMKNLTALMLLCVSLCLAACNTVEGIGRDIKRGGQHLENVAK
jgi:entericidin B